MTHTISQFEFDKERWRRLVEFIQVENAQCKYRLAEVVRTADTGNGFLEQAEFYQAYYIQQDSHLMLLKKDLYSFDTLLERQKFGDGALLKHVYSIYTPLKMEMNKLEQDFCKTKRRFCDFLEACTGVRRE